MANNNEGQMTVQEAGRKGGRTVSQKYGHDHFVEIGRMGGSRVRELIEEGKQQEQGGTKTSSRRSM